MATENIIDLTKNGIVLRECDLYIGLKIYCDLRQLHQIKSYIKLQDKFDIEKDSIGGVYTFISKQ